MNKGWVMLNGSINIALNKSYTYNTAPSGSYPDNGGVQLTNGLINEQTYLGREMSVAWEYANPDFIINLGKPIHVGACWFHTGGGGSGIFPPSAINVYLSDDGVNFGASKGSCGGAVNNWCGFNFAPTVAQYVKVIATRSNQWTSIGEVVIYSK
jgi:hypothetical protein